MFFDDGHIRTKDELGVRAIYEISIAYHVTLSLIQDFIKDRPGCLDTWFEDRRAMRMKLEEAKTRKKVRELNKWKTHVPGETHEPTKKRRRTHVEGGSRKKKTTEHTDSEHNKLIIRNQTTNGG